MASNAGSSLDPSHAFKGVLARFVRSGCTQGRQGRDKDTTLFPEFDATLAQVHVQEARPLRVLNACARAPAARGADRRPRHVRERTVASCTAHHQQQVADEWVPATLEAERRGLLTRSAVLAATPAPPSAAHLRGTFVALASCANASLRRRPGASDSQPAYPLAHTRRQRSEILQTTQPCGSCHKQMDAIGLGSTTSTPSDSASRATSTCTATSPHRRRRPVSSRARRTGHRLADSEQVQECVGRQWFRYAFGRVEAEADACTYAKVATDLGNSNGDLGAMFASVTGADGFRFRKTVD